LLLFCSADVLFCCCSIRYRGRFARKVAVSERKWNAARSMLLLNGAVSIESN
jgi:hypothetical protein